ncbi:MAG: hypothetical protein MRJ65_00815 [Candidatus Brocadiaceae bacterium]|nr:hypothetical protein [Candidatus Brocadiaceae bacterium]
MNMSIGFNLRKSQFSEYLVERNNLHFFGFEGWIFYQGMLFHDLQKWWGKGGLRDEPHEGLDFCFYQDENGQEHRLDTTTKIPVLYEGEIIRIVDDFLGKSIFVGHGINDESNRVLYTIYGHTVPYGNIDRRKTIQEGETIGTIAHAKQGRENIYPHIHVSMAWLPKSFPRERLTWETISDRSITTLSNPLEFISCEYCVQG